MSDVLLDGSITRRQGPVNSSTGAAVGAIPTISSLSQNAKKNAPGGY